MTDLSTERLQGLLAELDHGRRGWDLVGTSFTAAATDLAREVLRLRAVLQQAFDLIEVVYPDGDHPVTGECLADLWEGWKTRAMEVSDAG